MTYDLKNAMPSISIELHLWVSEFPYAVQSSWSAEDVREGIALVQDGKLRSVSQPLGEDRRRHFSPVRSSLFGTRKAPGSVLVGHSVSGPLERGNHFQKDSRRT
jgi:hypothetical protein